MSVVQFELTRDELVLIDDEEDQCVVLTSAQLAALLEYIATHPVDGHGWANHIRDDGSMTGEHKCLCHDLH